MLLSHCKPRKGLHETENKSILIERHEVITMNEQNNKTKIIIMSTLLSALLLAGCSAVGANGTGSVKTKRYRRYSLRARYK